MDDHDVVATEIVDAKKATIGRAQALKLVRQAGTVHVAKGRKHLRFKLRDGKVQGEASEADLAKAIIGPSGNLRAPTLWVGKTVYVGFLPEMYEPLT